MIGSHEILVSVITSEINDRECAMYDTTDEVNGLKILLDKVSNKQPLTYQEYTWLSDLTHSLGVSEEIDT